MIKKIKLLFSNTDFKKAHFFALLSFILSSMYGMDIYRRLLIVFLCYVSSNIIRIACSYILIASYIIPLYWHLYIQQNIMYTDNTLLYAHVFIVVHILLIAVYKKSKTYDSVPLIVSFFVLFIIDDLMQYTSSTTYAILFPDFSSGRTDTFFFEVLVLSTFFVFLNLFINNKLSYFITSNVLFFIGLVNYFLLRITGTPFAFRHLLFIKTAISVKDKVSLKKEDVIYFVFIIIVVIIFNLIIKKYVTKKSPSYSYTKVCCGMLCVYIIWYLVSGNANLFLFSPNIFYGEIPYFLSTLKNSSYKPENMEKYNLDSLSLKTNNDFSKGRSDNAEIIVIMSEAFADISRFSNAKFSTEYIPFTKEIMEEFPSGITYSSTWGNETTSSEYSFLTGIPTALTASGGEIYHSHMDGKKDSIVETFKSAGFNTIGIHPYYKDGYNRNTAWNCFDFDNTYFMDDFSHPEVIRDFISDKSLYERIIEECEKDNKSTFCFAVSMQNHAGYSEGIDIKTEELHINNKELNEYLTLQNETDKALHVLIDYYKNSNKDVYIMFFGDHQPMIPGLDEEMYGRNDLTENEIIAKYEIPYFIWSNTGNNKPVPKKTSMNYLGDILLKHINIDVEWFDYIDSIRKMFPVITDNFIFHKDEILFEWSQKELDSYDNSDDTDDFNQLKQYQVYSYLISSGEE